MLRRLAFLTLLPSLLLSGLLLSGSALAASGTVTVRKGDTLFAIAQRSGVPVTRLRAINGLKGNLIHPGQKLRLSGKGPPAANPPAKPARSRPIVYTVRAGDTLSKIASRVGISVAALKVANQIGSNLIRPGQRLKLPLPGTVKVKAVPALPPHTEVRLIYTYVRVRPHETLEVLARRYRVTANGLALLNRLSAAERRLYPGRRLLVPRRVPVPIPPRPRAEPLTLWKTTVLNIPVRVLFVDLRYRDVLVTPVLPPRGLGTGRGARVGTLARISGARAVVNGSYFHPRSYVPAGDVVMQGRMLSWGRIPGALAITPDNRATMTTSTAPLLGRPLETTWRGMETVIASGPRIVHQGVAGSSRGIFRDAAVFGRAARSAVGLKSNRDLVFVTTHARLSTTEMGRIMVRLGVREALLLDGGSSAGLAWDGRPVLESVRSVAYGIGVYVGYGGRRYAR
ncbi:LysM peptidoglycan-binding domain-containing protein [Deinococcus hopiensis]|uniref:LysM repeat-containing protein n=1 Tax=Deinococcus hopiensis KR-140 TaxID=695939 RepID=A0A1W1VNP7_9DEIO|nr:LysM peptidoglycan-binding domain-containing protein [Deinococcus hopiensis]SMB94850.1 LysM repeat-containing protein [Deinococcus hopiensis KR-140]